MEKKPKQNKNPLIRLFRKKEMLNASASDKLKIIWEWMNEDPELKELLIKQLLPDGNNGSANTEPPADTAATAAEDRININDTAAAEENSLSLPVTEDTSDTVQDTSEDSSSYGKHDDSDEALFDLLPRVITILPSSGECSRNDGANGKADAPSEETATEEAWKPGEDSPGGTDTEDARRQRASLFIIERSRAALSPLGNSADDIRRFRDVLLDTAAVRKAAAVFGIHGSFEERFDLFEADIRTKTASLLDEEGTEDISGHTYSLSEKAVRIVKDLLALHITDDLFLIISCLQDNELSRYAEQLSIISGYLASAGFYTGSIPETGSKAGPELLNSYLFDTYVISDRSRAGEISFIERPAYYLDYTDSDGNTATICMPGKVTVYEAESQKG